jgi:hypothetical protein
LLTEKFNNLYLSINIRVMIKARRHAVSMAIVRTVYEILVGKSEAKRPPVRPWHAWNENIEMDDKEGLSVWT